MGREDPLTVVRGWQEAANNRDVDLLLELSDPDIEMVGPRGSVNGHGVLRDWVSKAGLSLETLRTFARSDAVVMAQHGVWRDPDTGETTGEAAIATRFLVNRGRVTQLARHDGANGLDTALEESGLGYEDEV